MSDKLAPLNQPRFVEAMTRYRELFDNNARAFLLGAGCSKAANLPLTLELTEGVLKSKRLDDCSRQLLNWAVGRFRAGDSAHIEHYLSELVDFLAIVERRDLITNQPTLIQLGEDEYRADELRSCIEQVKQAIVEIIDTPVTLDHHRAFVRAVDRPLRDGRLPPMVDYLVLNYDTVLEDSLSIERIPFADGMEGGTTGWWKPSLFDRSDINAKVIKLHGSIDWKALSNDPLPRRFSPSIGLGETETDRILIWPASTKYKETQLDPYAQLADQARAALKPSHRSHLLLTVCGYSFGDEHINRELNRALSDPTEHLTVVVFTSEDEPRGQLATWRDDPATRDRLLIFGNKVFAHGDTQEGSDEDLVWWKFENFVNILRGTL